MTFTTLQEKCVLARVMGSVGDDRGLDLSVVKFKDPHAIKLVEAINSMDREKVALWTMQAAIAGDKGCLVWLADAYNTITAGSQYDVWSTDRLIGEINAGVTERPAGITSADVILQAVYPDPVWIVPDILPAGLSILAGRPKVGKSWLALQIAQAVSAGGMALGRRVENGRVLYLALEDSPRRLKDRMNKQNWPAGLPVDFVCSRDFRKNIGDLREGGSGKVIELMRTGDYRLTVIDTLSRATGGDQNDVSDMNDALAPLQEFSQESNRAVIILDHHRKTNGLDSDVVEDIGGSRAKGGIADTIIGLYKERGKAGAHLRGTGRDIEEFDLVVRMDWMTGAWQLEGNAGDLDITEKRQELLDTLGGLGQASLADVVAATGRNKGTLFRDLQDLVNSGLVRQDMTSRGGVYYLPDDNKGG